MSRTTPSETLEQRVAFLLKFTGGTMPVAMCVKTEAEAKAARHILDAKRHKAAKLVTITLAG